MMVNKFATDRCKVAHGDGGPLENGIYVAEVYFGWKILEWKDGSWWHTQGTGRWTACSPVQWVGPLPERKCTPGAKAAPVREFDL